MIVLSGASASGKTEVAKELEKSFGITKVITTTTRKMRAKEINGRDYFFVSVETFEKMIKDDAFVEYTKYGNNYYGSTKDQVKENRCVVIDTNGLKSYIALNNPQIVTFILEASDETRYNRMIQRGDGEEDAKARIINDKTAFKKEDLPHADYTINSEIRTIQEIAQLVVDLYQKTIKERQLEK